MILAQDKEKAIIGEKLILEDTIAHLNETIFKKDAVSCKFTILAIY